MDIVPKRVKSKTVMTAVLIILMLSGTATTVVSSYPTDSVYAQQQATINVVQRVVCNPPTPGCPTPDQFIIGVQGNDPNPASFPGSSDGTTVTVGPGDFFVDINSVPENPPEGYSLNNNFQGDCDGTIAEGQTVNCTITSTYFLPSTLRVIKQVECPAGVVCPQPSDFTIRVNGNPASPNSFAGSSTGTNVLLGIGSFNVIEATTNVPNPPGLVLAPIVSNGCIGSVTTPGQQLPDCIITNRYLPDTDGDGIANTWETNGIDLNNDGTIDYSLPGANSDHKNLWIEVDYMEFHRPVGGDGAFVSAMQDVRSSFASAPVSNPDGNDGITLFIDVDEQIPHEDLITFDDFETNIKNEWFGTATERTSPNAQNILAAKRFAFHYSIFAHQMTPGDPLGRGNHPGMNFVSSLGGANSALDPITNHMVGTRSMQASTFMHELGHNLNLDHGGNEPLDCKTNYISIMNGLTVESMYVDDAPLDFSRSALPSLNKGRLIEQNGIGQSTPPGLTTIYNGPSVPLQGPTLATAGMPIDWNFNNVIDQQPVSSDINADFLCGIPGPPSATGTINGFNDWGSPLEYVTTTGVPAASASLEASAESDQPSSFEMAEEASEDLIALQVAEEPEPDTDEPTYGDMQKARLDLLSGIDNAILRLGGEFNTFDIFEDLQLDRLDAAIEKLLSLKAQVIEEFGGEAANREVVPLIDNLIGVLENQKFPIPPPDSSCGPGSGNRVITGTPDPDTLIGTAVNNLISGLAGDDRINGCAGNDSINGNTGDDGIAGGPGHDALDGNEGDDVIQGGEGNDLLLGGPGINVLTGGLGRDSFVCSPDGETTITDFVQRTDVMSGPCILANAGTLSAAVEEGSTSDTENRFNAQEGSDVLEDIENDRAYTALGKHAENDGPHGDTVKEIKYRVSGGGNSGDDLPRGE